jgi:hypothetical protein
MIFPTLWQTFHKFTRMPPDPAKLMTARLFHEPFMPEAPKTKKA